MSARSTSSIRKAPMKLSRLRRSHGAHVVQFHYQGGWPKKRQWAMESLPLAYDWIFLVDADEALTPELAEEIRSAIQNPDCRWILRRAPNVFSGTRAASQRREFLQTLFVPARKRPFRVPPQRSGQFHGGHGSARARRPVRGLNRQDAKLQYPLLHHNVESLSHYIRKHDEYSNWDARVWLEGEGTEDLPPSLFGSQAQRRRWLRKKLFAVPGSPVLFFLYK